MVRERASSALSIPVALRVGAVVGEVSKVVAGESSWERSREGPLAVFLVAVLALAFFGDGALGFLFFGEEGSVFGFAAGVGGFLLGFSFPDGWDVSFWFGFGLGRTGEGVYFFAFDLEPLVHSLSWLAATWASAAACFWAAASAFCTR